MPSGMCLKSDGFASNLHDPDELFTLKEFCRTNGIPYADLGIPVRLDTFTAYGVAFQRRFVPNLNENLVTDLTREGSAFRLTLENGESISARRVVIAAGIAHFAYMPPALSSLPPEFASHSSKYHSFDQFKGRDVIVVGAGASAVDVAVSLRDSGAHAQLVTRRTAIPFHGKAPDKRSLLVRMKNPWSGLGPGWPSRLACDLPLLFHSMPRNFRLKIVRKHLGPAPGWFTRDKVYGHIPMHVGLTLSNAETKNGKVFLQFQGENGIQEIVADHVIAGTGYRIDVRRLAFLDKTLREEIATEANSPRLSTSFESSIPGLYFIGTCAASSFGPLLRFAFGARFASRRLTRRLTTGRSHARRAPEGLMAGSVAPTSESAYTTVDGEALGQR